MRRRAATLTVCLASMLSSGCMVLPHSGGPSVTTDAIDCLHGQWGGSCDGACGCGDACGDPHAELAWPDDPHWATAKRRLKKALRPDLGYEPPPAVPLSPGPPGRFFPVPARPAFEPGGHDPWGVAMGDPAGGGGV